MYIIKPYETAVSLFCSDGRVWHYPSLRAAVRAHGGRWLSNNVGEHFRRFSHAYWDMSARNGEGGRRAVYDEAQFIMRNDSGRPVTLTEIYAVAHSLRRWKSRYHTPAWNGVGPVPGIHKVSAGRHHCRHIRFANALRAAETFREEGEAPPRVKRSQKNLPNNWDDYQVASRQERSWKNYRRSQWK